MNRFSSSYNGFERSMLLYNSIVAPFIRSLWSLEAAHANASDVAIFWLAIAATLKDMFGKAKELGIPHSLVQAVTEIFNRRYEEFFENDIYFTTFALDPRMFISVLNLEMF